MSADLNAEREVDLARWRRALVALWWLPVAGLVLGAIVGVLYAFGGSKHFSASALVSLGQPVSPGGTVIASYNTNPRAISEITSSASAQAEAAAQAGIHPGALRGHVSVGVVGIQTGTGAARTAPLISVTVTGKRELPTAKAANALAETVVRDTTAPYVGEKIKTFQITLKSVTGQITSVNHRLAVITQAEKASRNLDPLQQLVVVSQEDNAETRLGNLIAQQETLQQQLAFAKQVESAKIVQAAAPVSSTAHSKKTSLVIGALIGLILGGIAAILAYGRLGRA
jgi:uncharacterized protein involved in exopolysaccharide biosynthesis